MCVYMYLLVVLPGGEEEQVPGERYKPPTHFSSISSMKQKPSSVEGRATNSAALSALVKTHCSSRKGAREKNTPSQWGEMGARICAGPRTTVRGQLEVQLSLSPFFYVLNICLISSI